MPIVGTAGHVDHGKSTLIRALTGRDPDRWAEERERGLTIDLGFAWTELDDGTEVGFVDVPGHERFIKNMLAGVGALDVALLVVAADEGWMPQSEEHLAVLDLLGVRRAVVALTRADLVDDDLLELAELELRDRLEGTALENAPVVATAAPEGRGIAELRARLTEAVGDATVAGGGDPRMWIDRAFTIEGAGTVVTGTLLDGPVSVGDELVLYPERVAVRVRGLQQHERSIDRAVAGTRTALNLAGIDLQTVGRGAMLGAIDAFRPTSRLTVELRTVRDLDAPLRSRGAYRFHAGSGSWPARLRLLDGAEPTGAGAALVETEGRIPLRAGDRFVLRDVGRRAVVAGGRVLDPHPPRKGADLRASVASLRDAGLHPDAVAPALLTARGIARRDELAADSGGGTPAGAIDAGDLVVAPGRCDRIETDAVAAARAYQDRNPLRPGIPKPEVATSLRVPPEVLEAVVDRSNTLVSQGAHVRTADFVGTLDDAGEAAWSEAEATLLEAGLSVPRRHELGLDGEQLHVLVREERLVEVSDDFVYPPATLEMLVGAVRDLESGFSVADFRDRFDITRKHAVPLLEWLDRTGVTRREGDGRVVR
ncbi:MAG: selenocysteine-specific translation elongation factor [Acidimicrobiia bacterium]|nr:selenocysteine-specific translation elongation factor [Acidimicrobiia bacterium]